MRLQEEMKFSKKIKYSLLFLFLTICPWFICCFLVLGYLSELEREKTAEYLTVHHCTTSECTISGTDEEDTSILSQASAHTNTHWHRVVSPWRESKCWVYKSERSTAQNTSTPCQCSVCTRERRGRSTSKFVVCMWYTMVVIKGFLDIGWHLLNLFYLLFFWEECYSDVKDMNATNKCTPV